MSVSVRLHAARDLRVEALPDSVPCDLADQLFAMVDRLVPAVGGRLESTVLAGFWIEVEWLWSEPLPKLRLIAARLGVL